MNVMNKMPVISIVFGVLLIVDGIVAYFGTGGTHNTALIPCGFGAVILICGILAMNPKLLKHAMHGGAIVGLLGLVGGAMRFFKTLSAGPEGSSATLAATGAMAVLCGMYVALCVKSFIEAKKARLAAASANPSLS